MSCNIQTVFARLGVLINVRTLSRKAVPTSPRHTLNIFKTMPREVFTCRPMLSDIPPFNKVPWKKQNSAPCI